jgi:hypothetical protein
MLNMDLYVLSVLIKAEIDRETHETDLHMQKLAWQTAMLMNATGNYKNQIKPNKLYEPLSEVNKSEKKNKPLQDVDIHTKREELLNSFK